MWHKLLHSRKKSMTPQEGPTQCLAQMQTQFDCDSDLHLLLLRLLFVNCYISFHLRFLHWETYGLSPLCFLSNFQKLCPSHKERDYPCQISESWEGGACLLCSVWFASLEVQLRRITKVKFQNWKIYNFAMLSFLSLFVYYRCFHGY